MKQWLKICSGLVIATMSCLGGLSGTVTDRAGKPLKGVAISLSTGISAISDAKGAWSLSTTQIKSSQKKSVSPGWNGEALTLNLIAPAVVEADACDLNGAIQASWGVRTLGPGSHQIPLPLRATGVNFLRVRIDGTQHTLMVFNGQEKQCATLATKKYMVTSGNAQNDAASARQLAFLDTLKFSWRTKLLAFLPIKFTDSSGIKINLDTNSVSPWNESFPYENIVDARDGKIYRAIVMQSDSWVQHWLVENLNYAGDKANPVGRCYGDSEDSCSRYGRLYRWSEAMGLPLHYDSAQWGGPESYHQGICPYHWHVPSNDDFDRIQIIAQGGYAGLRLKSISGWDSGNGSDSWGFRILPAGIRGLDFRDSGFFRIHTGAYFWSSTQFGSIDSWRAGFETYRNDLFQIHDPRLNAISLRCIEY